MKRVLIIGGHEETFRLLDGLDFERNIFQLSDFDYTDCAETARRARLLHETRPLDGVVSFTEYGLAPAAAVVEALGVRGNSPRAVRLTRDKLAMREFLAGSGIGSTRFRRCETVQDAEGFLREMGGDIILKPAWGSGKSGVFRVKEKEQIAAAWDVSRQAHPGPTIAEEFIEGPEYSVECLTRNGAHEILAITEKTTTGAPRYIELMHRLPAPLPPVERDEIASTVKTFLTAVGQSLGPAHVEVRKSPQGVKIIEGNTRAGGGFIWQLVQRAIGVDMVRETMGDLLGVCVPRAAGAGAGCARFFAFENAVVRSVAGLDEARGSKGVIRLECSLAAGQRLGPLRSSDDRQGAVVALGEDLAAAQSNLDRALARIAIKTKSVKIAYLPKPRLNC